MHERSVAFLGQLLWDNSITIVIPLVSQLNFNPKSGMLWFQVLPKCWFPKLYVDSFTQNMKSIDDPETIRCTGSSISFWQGSSKTRGCLRKWGLSSSSQYSGLWKTKWYIIHGSGVASILDKTNVHGKNGGAFIPKKMFVFVMVFGF